MNDAVQHFDKGAGAVECRFAKKAFRMNSFGPIPELIACSASDSGNGMGTGESRFPTKDCGYNSSVFILVPVCVQSSGLI
jgi:hypothetical protein